MEAAAAAAIVDAAITAGRASGDAVALPQEETNASSATPRMRYETFAQCDHYADDRQRRCLHAGKRPVGVGNPVQFLAAVSRKPVITAAAKPNTISCACQAIALR